MAKVIVGQPVNGISINSELEFLLDNEGSVRYFESTDTAKAFLKENGYTEEDLAFFTFMENCGICQRCGAPLFKGLLPEYDYQCFACDEDFYAFEQHGSTD